MADKIIHQIWYQGEGKIPAKLKNYKEGCKKVNSEYKQYIWDGEMIERFIEDNYPEYEELYKGFPLMIQKIDFAKYLILHFYGGVYVDMDVKCLKKVNKLIGLFAGKEMMVAPAPKEIPFDFYNKMTKYIFKFDVTETDRYINNGIIIANKNHGFFLYLCDEIQRRFKDYKYGFVTKYITRDGYVWVSTGPAIFTKCLHQYRNKQKEGIEIIDEKYLEPCSEVSESCDTTGSYFIHDHQRSWVGLGEGMVTLRRWYTVIKKNLFYVVVGLLTLILILCYYFHRFPKHLDIVIGWLTLKWIKMNKVKNGKVAKGISKLGKKIKLPVKIPLINNKVKKK